MNSDRLLPEEEEFKNNDFLDELEGENGFFNKFGWVVVIILIVLTGFGIREYFFKRKLNDHQPPNIKASKEHIKVKPLDPGGMVVPDMDKSIYDNLSANNIAKVERILPLPEEPMDRVKIIDNNYSKENFEQLNNSFTDENEIKENVKVKEPSNEISSYIAETEAVKAPVSLIEPIDALEADLQQEKTVKKKPEAASSSNLSGFKVQLASVRTYKEATIEWVRIKKECDHALKKYKNIIEKKDLPGKGTFYRLQIGPIPNELEAKLLCKKLNLNRQKCFIVKPEN
jgi:cell division septation protein DedD